MTKTLESVAKRVARIMMRQDLLWELARRLPRHEFFLRQRQSVVNKSVRKKCGSELERQEVQAGPFMGLRYAQTAAVGSSLWPKLMGTYESELKPLWSRIKERGYRKIVDVGYAEGFYLLGLGRMFQEAELVGFDIEPEAERQCRANAEVNDISEERLQLYGEFNAQSFDQTVDADSLVIVDCEGFENEVVGGLDQSQLKRADWLIETHDHLVEGTTQRLKIAFAETHEITEVETDDDLSNKCKLLPTEIRRRCDPYEQEALVTECRLAKQRWIFATRKAA